MTTHRNKIKRIEALLPGVLAVDRQKARGDIRRLSACKGKAWPAEKIDKQLAELEKRLRSSAKKKEPPPGESPAVAF